MSATPAQTLPDTTGRTASLRPLTDARGVIRILALDHRDAMRNAYKRAGITDVTDQVMLDVKAKIIDALAPQASAILLDSLAISLPRPFPLGVIMPLETQGHDSLAGGRLNRLMTDFSSARAAELGARGCKLLLYYRADHRATAKLQLGLAAAVARECHQAGLALIVEPKVYRLEREDESVYLGRFGGLVVAGAEHLARSGADLLKLQYPGSVELCKRVSEAASPVPWTLLGGEIDGDTFTAQLQDACAAGASGFIAGRAIWGHALSLEPSDQQRWLESDAQPLLERLIKITETHARRIV
jgi:tagatose 1,6-diphosphate aldolase